MIEEFATKRTSQY